MMRLLSFLYVLLLDQRYSESMEFFWRVFRETKKGGKKGNFYGRILHRMFRSQGASIGLDAKIGENMIFPHGIVGVFISNGAIIGKNCVVFQQVTIGSNTIEGSKGFGAPHIGDNVYIGAGAKIIGKVSIGDNCRIGAGCVVTCDIPDGATVVLSKPRIIIDPGKKGYDNSFKEYHK